LIFLLENGIVDFVLPPTTQQQQFLCDPDTLSQALVHQAAISFCASATANIICNIFEALFVVDEQFARDQYAEALPSPLNASRHGCEGLAVQQKIHHGEISKVLEHQDEEAMFTGDIIVLS
jgi:hypothetical protein